MNTQTERMHEESTSLQSIDKNILAYSRSNGPQRASEIANHFEGTYSRDDVMSSIWFTLVEWDYLTWLPDGRVEYNRSEGDPYDPPWSHKFDWT